MRSSDIVIVFDGKHLKVPFDFFRTILALTDIDGAEREKIIRKAQQERSIFFADLAKHIAQQKPSAQAVKSSEDSEGFLSGIIVEGPEGGFPFSKGILTQSINASGIDPNIAYNISRAIQEYLVLNNIRTINRRELRRLVYDKIKEMCDEEAAMRYLIWRSVGSLKKPLAILIGGTTGGGKSTLAVELAHRLGITAVISTDIIREIMRSMLSPQLMPFIHASSYTAWKTSSFQDHTQSDSVILSFQEQVLRVKVGIDAIIKRSATEKTSLILNGVHILPGIVRCSDYKDVYAFMAVCVVHDENAHRSRFTAREFETKNRLSKKYLENFTHIRRIQTFILELAKRHNVLTLEQDELNSKVTITLQALTEFIRKLPDFTLAEI